MDTKDLIQQMGMNEQTIHELSENVSLPSPSPQQQSPPPQTDPNVQSLLQGKHQFQTGEPQQQQTQPNSTIPMNYNPPTQPPTTEKHVQFQSPTVMQGPPHQNTPDELSQVLSQMSEQPKQMDQKVLSQEKQDHDDEISSISSTSQPMGFIEMIQDIWVRFLITTVLFTIISFLISLPQVEIFLYRTIPYATTFPILIYILRFVIGGILFSAMNFFIET